MFNWVLKIFRRLTSCSAGFLSIEVLLSGAIFSILATVALSGILISEEEIVLSGQRARAIFLAEEGLEATRNIRDFNLADLADGVYGLSTTTGVWRFSGVSDITGLFTRSIEVSGIDISRKLITATVFWQQNPRRIGKIILETYLSAWRQALALVGDWSDPIKEAEIELVGNQNGWKVASIGTFAYLIRVGGAEDFVVIDISDTNNPVVVASLDLDGGLRNIQVRGDYAFVVSSDNSAELQIIDISTPSAPSLVATYDAPGTADARGVFIDDYVAYIVRATSGNDEFAAIDISDPVSPVFLGSVGLGMQGNEVVVLSGYAYVGSNSNTQELQIIDVRTPASPLLIGFYGLDGPQNIATIAGFDNTILAGRATGDLHIFDASLPGTLSLLGTYNDFGDDIQDIALGVNNNYAFLASDADTAELQIVNITTSSAPVIIGTYDLLGDLNGLVYNADIDKIIATGDENSEEFVIFGSQ